MRWRVRSRTWHGHCRINDARYAPSGTSGRSRKDKDHMQTASYRRANWLERLDETRKRLPWLALKNLVLVMLAFWIVYFAAIHMYVGTLNKIDVPLLELPLGVCLAIQGAVIVFAVALYMFTKKRRAFGMT